MKVFARVLTYGPMDRNHVRFFHWAGREHPEWDLDYYHGTAGVCETRNEVVLSFLGSDATHLWMLDHDCVPMCSDRLLTHDKSVVCGLYPRYVAGVGAFWQVYRPRAGSEKGGWEYYPPQEWPEGEVFEAPVAGTGCMVVERSVLEGIKPPWFHFDYTSEGVRVGEDIVFSQKAGGVWVDKKYIVSHYREVDLVDIVMLSQYAALGAQAARSLASAGSGESNPYTGEDLSDIPPPPGPVEESNGRAPRRRGRRRRGRRR